jgi:hypothetical protein
MNTLTNLNQELFTELAPTESASLQGGGKFGTFVSFDDRFKTRKFNVSEGGSVELSSFTNSAPKNPIFKAVLIGPNKQEAIKTVNVGTDNTFWKGLKGGDYNVQLRESNNINVKGRIEVNYT